MNIAEMPRRLSLLLGTFVVRPQEKATTGPSRCFVLMIAIGVLGFISCTSKDIPVRTIDPLDNYVDWSIYRGDKKGNQYAELAQIHAANVHRLEPAWQYRTGDASANSSIQVNPIMVDGLVYLSTPTLQAVALNAATGEEVWTFSSAKYNEGQKTFRGRTRGVTYWSSEDGSDQRIFLFVKDRVYALQAKTGEIIEDFGDQGHIDLRENMGLDPAEVSIEVTSPGIVYQNYLIVGSRVPEGYQSTPGDVKAYDVVTGEFRWIFHTIPRAGELGYETWQFVEGETYGGANPWGGFTVDEERGWVFFATGSPAYDFYGGHRKGQNLFGNCVLALDATTGERIWHYQTVHHDIWDYDNPSAPVLVTIQRGETRQDAVVQLTKMGLVFVLDRDTGRPLFPTLEMPVPPSQIPGEEAWPTQPFPVKPAPLTRLGITEADLTTISAEANAYAKKKFADYQATPLYAPPSEKGTLTSPSLLGGVEWQGASFDPYSNMLYVNTNNVASISKLGQVVEPVGYENATEAEIGYLLYSKNCTSCHGLDRKGIPPLYPPLLSLNQSKEELMATIRNGRNIMPAFRQFDRKQIAAMAEYLSSDQLIPGHLSQNDSIATRTRYVHSGYDLFVDQDGYPGTDPPWGTLNAIDLSTGDYVWKKPLGEYPDLVRKGIPPTGTLNYGGAVATAGGVVFIAATADEKFRAFEQSRGKLLWEYDLPAGGYATPSIYMHGGRQYVVIVAGGGGKNRTKSGDYVIAFALPEDGDKSVPEVDNADEQGWISLFDGESLDGWVHMNGSHVYTVEDGAIMGRTMPNSLNSFLCSLQEFADFELTCEVYVDDVTNQGVQFRSSVRPVSERDHDRWRAGRVWGPQLEIRRKMGDKAISTGMLYGEALGTGWLSSDESLENPHDHYQSEAWNRIRIVADGPRMQTYVNGHLIEDVVNEEVYATHPKGFIGLQVHGIKGDRQYRMGWRDIKVRPMTGDD